MNTRISWPLVFRLLMGLGIGLFAGSAFAQSSSSLTVQLPGSAMISFVSFDKLPLGLQFEDQGKVFTPVIPGYGKSAPFQYTGGSPFVLFKQTIDMKGTPVRVTLATASYPAGWKKILIVLFSGTRTDPLHALAFEDSDDAFPRGFIRLFNFHPQAIAVASGGSVGQLAVGESRLIAMPDRDSYSRVCLKMAILRNGQWQELPIWAMQARPTSRALVFAYEKVTQNGLQSLYLTVPEILPPAKPTPDAASQ